MPQKVCAHSTPCKERVVAIVGDCKHCTRSYCQKHRLPETHDCSGMENCRQEHFKRNEDKLLNQQTGGTKIDKV